MSQNPIQVPTQGTVSGLTMAQDMNGALLSLLTLLSGASAPTTAGLGAAGSSVPSLAGVLWHDTASNTIKLRNQADTGWITLFALDEVKGGAVSPMEATSVYSTVSTSLSISGTWTSISWNTVAFDDGGWWISADPTRLTFPVAGRYRITGAIGLNTNMTSIYGVRIYKNSSAEVAKTLASLAASGTNGQSSMICHVADYDTNDYVELQAYQATGETILTYNTSALTYFIAERLR